jgi:hypothetical protein
MSEEINHDRRRFLRNAAMTIAAANLVMIGSAEAQSSKAKPPQEAPQAFAQAVLEVDGY